MHDKDLAFDGNLGDRTWAPTSGDRPGPFVLLRFEGVLKSDRDKVGNLNQARLSDDSAGIQ